jgi:hypothetical protein
MNKTTLTVSSFLSFPELFDPYFEPLMSQWVLKFGLNASFLHLF